MAVQCPSARSSLFAVAVLWVMFLCYVWSLSNDVPCPTKSYNNGKLPRELPPLSHLPQGRRSVELADLNAVIAVVTHDKFRHLERILAALLYAGASRTDIIVFDDSSEPAKSSNEILSSMEGVAYHHFHLDTHITDYVYLTNSHFHHVFEEVFTNMLFDFVIVLEDDLLLSPDALHYFRASIELMREDPTVFCATAWNDNSFQWASRNHSIFHRMEHFGGLGWTTSARHYTEHVQPIWRDHRPYWDTIWQQAIANAQLECIHPELPRAFHAPELDTSLFTEEPHDRWGCQAVSKAFEPGVFKNFHELYSAEGYEQNVMIPFLENAIDLRFPEEHLSFPHWSNFVYLFYDDAWGDVLDTFDMWSSGLGGVIRGVHKSTVWVRLYGKLVLLVSYSSNYVRNPELRERWMKHRSNNEPVIPGPQNVLQARQRVLQQRNVTVAVSLPGLSCTETCELRNAQCDVEALFAMHSCDTLQKLSDEHGEVLCANGCVDLPRTDYPDRSQLSMPIRKAGGGCVAASAWYLNCGARHDSTHRLCPCTPAHVAG